MTDEERALEVMRGLAPMRVCYTDAGAAAEVINRIAAALAAERERCLASIAEAIVDVQTDMEGADAEQLRDLENVEHGLMLAEGRIRALGDDR